jgi:hypothetical protein
MILKSRHLRLSLEVLHDFKEFVVDMRLILEFIFHLLFGNDEVRVGRVNSCVEKANQKVVQGSYLVEIEESILHFKLTTSRFRVLCISIPVLN